MVLFLCPTSRKHIHDDRKTAAAHLRGLREIRSEYDGRVYLCMDCGGFHVGRWKKRAHRSKFGPDARTSRR